MFFIHLFSFFVIFCVFLRITWSFYFSDFFTLTLTVSTFILFSVSSADIRHPPLCVCVELVNKVLVVQSELNRPSEIRRLIGAFRSPLTARGGSVFCIMSRLRSGEFTLMKCKLFMRDLINIFFGLVSDDARSLFVSKHGAVFSRIKFSLSRMNWEFPHNPSVSRRAERAKKMM